MEFHRRVQLSHFHGIFPASIKACVTKALMGEQQPYTGQCFCGPAGVHPGKEGYGRPPIQAVPQGSQTWAVIGIGRFY